MTNREKIEKMTVKEFAEELGHFSIAYFFDANTICDCCMCTHGDKKCVNTNCFDGIREWLEQEAKDE